MKPTIKTGIEAATKTAIVTGAAGFIGVHLSEKLLRQGYQVIGVDNFCTGNESNKKYLESLNLPFWFYKADVCDDWQGWLSKIPSSVLAELNYVFHFASPASPIHYQKLSLETLKANSIGLEKAIACANQQGARVIFSSTSEVYGDPEVSPQAEDYWGNVNSFGPRSCYDEAKRFGEALIYSSNKRHGTQHGLVRIFNTYGPRMDWNDGRVVINFLKQGLRGEDLTIYGDGTQTRSFCYIDDLVTGVLHYADKGFSVPFNLGNQEEFLVSDVAKKVQKIFPDKKLGIVYQALPSEDPKKRRPDLTQSLRLLQPWKPLVSLDEGLILTLKWLKENY